MSREAFSSRKGVVAMIAGCCSAAALGCQSTTQPARPAAINPEAAAVVLDAPLSFVVEGAEGPREIHTPMVRARVFGVECWLIVDSGATDPVFTRALADEVGASLAPTEPGTDHAGAPVRSWRAQGSWTVAIEGWHREIEAPLVIEGPPPFEGWDIGGFLSPQQLAPHATLMLDLRRQRLLLIDGAPSAELLAPLEDLELVTLPRQHGTGDAARLLLVEGSLGAAPLRLMLNTGGRHAEFSPSALRLPPDAEEGEAVGKGLSGAAVAGVLRRGETLALGGHSIPLDELLVREQGASYGGQLGMRLLRGTVIVASADPAEPIRWWRAKAPRD